MPILWFILGWIVLAIAVLGALWVIGWAYQLGVKAGRKQLLNEVTAAVQTPAFFERLARELQLSTSRELVGELEKRQRTALPIQ